MPDINTDIRFLKGVGERRSSALSAMGIDTVGALLRFYPRTYEDFSKITPISRCPANEKVCIKATVTTDIKEQFVRKNMVIYKFTVADGSGTVIVTIFNNKYLAARLKKGREYLFLGRLSQDSFAFEMSSPEIKEVGSVGIEPIYRSSKTVTSEFIKKLVRTALESTEITDPIPENIQEKYALCDIRTALFGIHFPKTYESLKAARRRLVFEELFVLQTGLMLLKRRHKRHSSFVVKNDCTGEFLSLLPFELTGA